ncbi:hypothetical protein D9M73_282130 [compost metagenome]
MGQAGVGFQRALFEQLDGQVRRIGDRHDLVVFAVQHQGRHVDGLQVVGKVGFREGFDAVVLRLGPTIHALAPPVVDDRLGDFRARAIEAIEGTARKITIKP